VISKEIKAKSIISPSALPGVDFVINPYAGCLHACVYCYARFMKRFMNEPLEWGEFCHPKINAVELVAKEIKKIPERSSIMFSSVTDTYNPLERKYELTRKILEILVDYNIDVSILTKSDLVLRDLDILKKIRQIEVGFTVTTTNKKFQKIIEPGASSPQKRIEALRVLKQSGISTYAFIGPILPYFTDLENIFEQLSGIVEYVFVDTFNTKGANWDGVMNVLKKYFPNLIKKYKEIYFNEKNYRKYVSDLRIQIQDLSKQYNIPVKMVFR
jgi:DNA repair photolyase